MSDLEYPAGLRYTAEHEWVRTDGGHRACRHHRVRPGGARWRRLREPAHRGRRRTLRGTPCGEVESTKSVSDLYAPVSGEVTAVNGAPGRDSRAREQRPLRRGLDVRAASGRRRRRRRPHGRRRVHLSAVL